MSETETYLDRGLAAKGIGPKGLKPMSKDELIGVMREIAGGMHPEALSATFMMAFQVLERDDEERRVFNQVCADLENKLSEQLNLIAGLFNVDPKSDVERILIKLANCEDLNNQECRFVIEYLLDSENSEAYKAALLQGLRVKRETDAENLALYSELFSQAPRRELQNLNKTLVDWSDPYDGLNRHANLSVLGAVVLSAMGIPVVIHSAQNLGPKYGKTVLDWFEKVDAFDLDFAERSLGELNLAILNQDCVYPELSGLKSMRNAMRKRPFLATVEKMLMPLRSNAKNLLVTGYVHKAYKSAIPKMVMDHGQFDQIFLVKGIEGSVLLDPSKKIPAVFSDRKESFDLDLELESRSESPKSDVNACDISEILKGDDPRWDCIAFTVSKIIEIGLGDGDHKSIMSKMARLKNEGLFLAHFEKVSNFFNRSGEYA